VKIITKKVYYCGYCRKHSLCSVATHEAHCTLNPNRICRLCERTEPLTELIEKYRKQIIIVENSAELSKGANIEDIKKDTGSCPNCTLALIRILKLNKFPLCSSYDYKKALEDYWNDRNAEELEREIF